MKNFTRIAGIIALVSIIGLSFASCGGGAGGTGGNIPVLVKAYDNKGVEHQRISIPRAVVGGPLRAVTNTASFEPLEDTYDDYGSSVKPYTPTQFNLRYAIDAVLSDGKTYPLAQGESYDFVKGLTVEVGEVQPGYTISGFIVYFDHGDDSNLISFPKDGESITVDTMYMRPQFFVFYEDTLKFVPSGEAVTDPLGRGGLYALNRMSDCVVFPFEPKVISDSTSSITLNIGWDLTGIVTEYSNDPYGEGKYYFTKGWWNKLYVYASVN